MLEKSIKNLFIFLIAEKKPIRKPDPNLRQLQRQISFGSGAPLIGLGSLKKKQMSTGKIIFLSPNEGLKKNNDNFSFTCF